MIVPNELVLLSGITRGSGIAYIRNNSVKQLNRFTHPFAFVIMGS